MKKLALKRYAVVHSLCTGNLDARYDAEAQTSLRNMTYHRRLYLTMLTPKLNKMSIIEDRRDRLTRFYLRYGDRGALFFFDQTKPNATLPVYRDRTSLLYYLCRFSPKLSYLAVLLQQICQVHKRKALLFCDWPATAWLVEVLVLLLGFQTLTIRARHKSSERDRAIALFNDPESAFQVLVTNVKVSSTALNLQGDCSAVIFVDVPSNAQSTQQAACRVIRIGQRKACNIYILTTDHT